MINTKSLMEKLKQLEGETGISLHVVNVREEFGGVNFAAFLARFAELLNEISDNKENEKCSHQQT